MDPPVTLPTTWGTFKVYALPGDTLVLTSGNLSSGVPLVRIHSECLTGDVFGSLKCDCGEQLRVALQEIHQASSGILIYLRQEGRGLGLVNKIRAYHIQEHLGLDTVEANQHLGYPPDLRNYSEAARILKDLGILRVRLLTNNPDKIQALQEAGISVIERVPLETTPRPQNSDYLITKARKMGHLFSTGESPLSSKTEG